jgi:tetratricopeptide (TPR) repeat protein
VAKLNIAAIALDLGQNGEARAMLDDVLAIHRRNENVAGIGFALLNRGVANYGLGDHEASRRDFEEARECFEEIGMPLRSIATYGCARPGATTAA